MKARKVVMKIEMTTDIPMELLRMREIIKAPGWVCDVHKVRVSLIRRDRNKDDTCER